MSLVRTLSLAIAVMLLPTSSMNGTVWTATAILGDAGFNEVHSIFATTVSEVEPFTVDPLDIGKTLRTAAVLIRDDGLFDCRGVGTDTVDLCSDLAGVSSAGGRAICSAYDNFFCQLEGEMTDYYDSDHAYSFGTLVGNHVHQCHQGTCVYCTPPF